MPAAPAREIPLSKLTIEKLADKLGPLDAAEKIHKATVAKPRADITAEIQARYEKKPADQQFTAQGERFAMIVGPKKIEREITSRSKLRKALGALFNDLWDIGLGKIDKALDALGVADRGEFLSESMTGNRSITVVRNRE